MGLPSVWNNDVGQASLVGGGGITPPEMYIELWWYSENSCSASDNNSHFAQKGTITSANFNPTSQSHLHTLNASWNPNNKYAFEASLYTTTSSFSANAYLYDITTSSTVSGSMVSTTSTTMTVLRSSQFTLTPGHVYGVYFIFSNTSGGTTYLTDASLIVFPS